MEANLTPFAEWPGRRKALLQAAARIAADGALMREQLEELGPGSQDTAYITAIVEEIG